MELFEPKNFFDLAGVFAGVIGGAIGLVGLLIATETLRTAKDALNEWEKEKRFDIDIDGFAKSVDAIKILEDLLIDQYNPSLVREAFNQVLNDINSYNETDVYRSLVHIFSYSNYYNKLKPQMFDMRRHSIKVFQVSENSELKDFYDKYISVEANIFAIHHNYHFSIINDFIERYNYPGLQKEEYAVCIYFNSLKTSNPNKSDTEIYRELYMHFFHREGGDPLGTLRSQMVSFIYNKFKK